MNDKQQHEHEAATDTGAEDTEGDRAFPSWKRGGRAADGVADSGAEGDGTDQADVAAEDEYAIAVRERDEYLDQLQRSRAEFVNFRRRNDQERAALRQFVSREVISQFLPVIDDLDRALTAIPESERTSGWVTGVTMIQTKLHNTMERLGVSAVEALGLPFDPALHEAVATEPGTSGEGVVEVYQSGYRIGDVLVRPAMVKTGNLPEPAPVNDNGQPEDARTNANENAESPTFNA